MAYRRWLTTVRFDHPAQQIVLQDYIYAVQDAEARRDRLTRQINDLLPSWSMAPVAIALQAMCGVALVVAVTVVAEVGDFRRFANPRQLMAYPIARLWAQAPPSGPRQDGVGRHGGRRSSKAAALACLGGTIRSRHWYGGGGLQSAWITVTRNSVPIAGGSVSPSR